MTYQIVIEKQVAKFLKLHPEVVEKFLYCVDCIAEDPDTSACDTKKLKGIDAYRLRIGKRRFLYKIDHETIIVYFFDADSRGGIYKRV